MRPSKELIAEWYAKLKESGFVDIEETRHFGMSLIDRHNNRFVENNRANAMLDAEEYQVKVEAFLHSDFLTQLCTSIDRRKRRRAPKRNVYTGNQVRSVWEMHCNGCTEKDIATSLGFTISKVHRILTQLRTWMDLQ